MSDATIALPTRLSRRIEKLAREAGHTPDEMLKLVIRDGLEYCEYAVKSANEGLADLDAGRSVTAEGMPGALRKTPDCAPCPESGLTTPRARGTISML